MAKKPVLKPRLRGVSHGISFVLAAIASVVLLFQAQGTRAMIATLIYSATLLLMFGVSAAYHLPKWEPRIRERWRKADHSAIFLMFAGTATPFCMLVLPPGPGKHLMSTMWIGAGVGVLQSLFWIRAPKYVTAVLALALGWLGAPYLPDFISSLGSRGGTYMLIGGLSYSAGAVVYALKRPNPWPQAFGYHEVFHLLVIGGAAFHFAAVSTAVSAAATGLPSP